MWKQLLLTAFLEVHAFCLSFLLFEQLVQLLHDTLEWGRESKHKKREKKIHDSSQSHDTSCWSHGLFYVYGLSVLWTKVVNQFDPGVNSRGLKFSDLKFGGESEKRLVFMVCSFDECCSLLFNSFALEMTFYQRETFFVPLDSTVLCCLLLFAHSSLRRNDLPQSNNQSPGCIWLHLSDS